MKISLYTGVNPSGHADTFSMEAIFLWKQELVRFIMKQVNMPGPEDTMGTREIIIRVAGILIRLGLAGQQNTNHHELH